MKSSDGKEVIGWENIELISDRPLEVMLEEFKRLKAEFPDRVLIASIMEEYDKAAVSLVRGWGRIVLCRSAGVGRAGCAVGEGLVAAGGGHRLLVVLQQRGQHRFELLQACTCTAAAAAVGGAH
jgi:hypothetical protein